MSYRTEPRWTVETKSQFGVSIGAIVFGVFLFSTFQAETIAWYYLWFFILMEFFAIPEGIGALRMSNLLLKNRLAYIGIMIVRVATVIGIYLLLLFVLRTESMDPMWILLIAALVACAESFVKRLAQRHLLKIPLPTLLEFD